MLLQRLTLVSADGSGRFKKGVRDTGKAGPVRLGVWQGVWVCLGSHVAVILKGTQNFKFFQ